MSRLGLGLGLSRGRAFSPFDPLSLNPIIAYEMHESMMAPLASESLDLDPANPSSLDIITATRAGTATYTDASGNIQTASPNTVRVDHVQGEELTPTKYQYVGNTDLSDWGSGAITTSTDGTLAPDGNIANKYVPDNGAGSRNVNTAIQSIAVSNNTYTFSSYIKNAGFNRVHYYVTAIGGTGVAKGSLELSTGNFSRQGASGDFSNAVYSVEDAGNGWYRFIMSFNVAAASGTGLILRFYPEESDGSGFTGNGVDGIYIAMPQFEEGTTVSDFVANTTGSPKYFAAATYAPRVPMILVEPAATNLVENTDFSSGWVQGGLTISDGGGLSGQVSKVVENDDAGSGNTFYFNVPTIEGWTYTGGFWIRRISGSGSIALHHTFSPTGSQTSITDDVTPEWTFVSAQFLGKTGGGFVRFGVRVYYTSGDSVEIAMPQVERGVVATSFIPTSGSAVTRAADLLIIDGSDFTDFYNQSEGTFYQEVSSKIIAETNWYLSVSDNTNNSGMEFTRSAGTHRVAVKGQTEKSFSTAVLGQIHRLAMSHDSSASEFRASVDGVNSNPNPITGVTIPTNLTQLNIGSRYNGWTMIGHIKRLIYWPYHSDNL